MNVDIFTLCDSAQDYNGKMIIVGTFNSFQLSSFPSPYPDISIAVRLRFDKDEIGKHTIEISIIKSDDNKYLVNPVHAQFDIKEANDDNLNYYTNFILKLNNILIPSAGKYTVILKVDGNEKQTFLNVSKIQKV